jgi:signal transduction histidine kinase
MPYDGTLITDLIKEVGTQALSMPGCEPFIQWILGKMPLIIEHDAAAIILSSSGNPVFYQKTGKPCPEDFISEFRRRVLDCCNTQFTVPLPINEPRIISLDEPAQENPASGVSVHSFYCVPLVGRGNILGAFAICSREGDVFLAYRLNLFNVFAGQAALAIDSLQARERVMEQARIIERESAKMKIAFSGMSDGIVLTDESDKVILVNPVARQIFDLPESEYAEIPGSFISDFLSPVLKDLSATEKLFVSREIEEAEPYKLILRADATKVKDAQGKKMGAVILVRDITPEKEIDRLKSEFLSAVSHELRTPLTTIRESVSQVLDGILGATTAEQREFLTICLNDIDRLTRIINDLLDISKIEARKVQLRKSETDVVALVRGVCASFASRVRDKGLEIRTDFSGEKIEAFIDRDKIIQVFTNLVGNSLKFTARGYISISVRDADESVECVVSDTGRGISDEDLPKVFSKFQQFGRECGPGEKGTGLGLSIAKEIVELHRGKMRVESTLNEGTRFIFFLPKHEGDQVERKE